MKLRITARVPGAPALRIGDVIEKPHDEARTWLNAGVAVAEPSAHATAAHAPAVAAKGKRRR